MSCTICLNEYNEDPEEDSPSPAKRAKATASTRQVHVTSTACGHVFHVKCLTEWLQKHGKGSYQRGNMEGTCPKCRKRVQQYQLRTIYPDSLDDAKHVKTEQRTENGEVSDKQLLQLLQKDYAQLEKKYLHEKGRAEALEALLYPEESKGNGVSSRGRNAPLDNDLSSDDEFYDDDDDVSSDSDY